jgi:hypothetical protein
MVNLENEVWKDVPGYENLYQASTMGRLKSVPDQSGKYSFRLGNVLKRRIGKAGYPYYTVFNSGNSKTVKEHRMVAIAFIPNPENKPCVNHINGIKHDNRVENLEWVTYSENSLHANLNKLRVNAKGANSKKAALNEKQVEEIRSVGGQLSYKKIGDIYNVSATTIWKVIKKLRY